MQLISFFSGIGGFEVAAEWMGWEIISSCEINPFGQRILKHYWPDVYHHDNVKTVDYEEIRKRIDKSGSTVFVAGFPCQPFSTAGKRKGTKDDRYGWPDCIEAVREFRPGWCVFENVRGLTNWNGGVVFDQVQADLEAEGYEVLPFLLPACAVNAPHRRDRIWIVAHSSAVNGHVSVQQWGQNKAENTDVDRSDAGRTPANTSSQGLPFGLRSAKRQDGGTNGAQSRGKPPRIHSAAGWAQFPTQPPIRERNDGISDQLDFAAVFEKVPHPRQPARAYGKWRNESIKAFGNSVVPQLVLQIFKAIEQYETLAKGRQGSDK